MPDISTYIKINNKNVEECVEVEDPKSDVIVNNSNCRKVTFRYVIVLLAWLAVGIILLYMNLAVRGSCKHDVWNGVEWQIYKDLHGKNYTEDEDEKRICIFLENKKEIEYHNLLFEAGFESYQKEINMFSDFTPEELEELKGFQMSLENSSLLEAFDVRDGIVLPESYDWRSKGAVSGVKNQGNCGSCYAFSATGSLEAQHFLKTGQLVSLSEQNIVDCSMPQGNKGCKGGNMNNAFRYILQNNGIDNEQSYPYEGTEGPCRFQQGGVGATVKGYRTVTPSEGALQAAVVAIGPISIGINVTPNFFKYKTGIFQDDSCDPFSLNHAVLVVGFGSDGIGQDYWILKNSWGTTWGEGGYMRIARNMGNMCGIVTMASYPLV